MNNNKMTMADLVGGVNALTKTMFVIYIIAQVAMLTLSIVKVMVAPWYIVFMPTWILLFIAITIISGAIATVYAFTIMSMLVDVNGDAGGATVITKEEEEE